MTNILKEINGTEKQLILLTEQNKNNSLEKENQQSSAFKLLKKQFVQKMANTTRKHVISSKNAITLSHSNIDFGRIIPGNICEEEVKITNTTRFTLLAQIVILCQNEEYESLDEYVFSIRKLINYEYNEKLVVPIQPSQLTQKKINQQQVPNDKSTKKIKGELFVKASGFENLIVEGTQSILVEAKLEKPSIICSQMLYSSQNTYFILFVAELCCEIIALAFKIGKKMECKIPLKNNSLFPIVAECGFLSKFAENFPYEVQLTTLSPTIQPETQFFLTIQLKPKNGSGQPADARQVLVAKIKNSTIYFGFPIFIRIC